MIQETSLIETEFKGTETWWKQFLDVHRPYQANLRHLGMGFVLQIGYGVGRNPPSSRKLALKPLA